MVHKCFKMRWGEIAVAIVGVFRVDRGTFNRLTVQKLFCKQFWNLIVLRIGRKRLSGPKFCSASSFEVARELISILRGYVKPYLQSSDAVCLTTVLYDDFREGALLQARLAKSAK